MAEKTKIEWDWRVVLGAITFVLLAIVLIAPAVSSGGGDSKDNYSTCAELATSPGTDVATARCVDDNGDVIAYKDSSYGKAVTDLAGQ